MMPLPCSDMQRDGVFCCCSSSRPRRPYLLRAESKPKNASNQDDAVAKYGGEEGGWGVGGGGWMGYIYANALASSPQVHVARIQQRGGVMHAAAHAHNRLILRTVSTDIVVVQVLCRGLIALGVT